MVPHGLIGRFDAAGSIDLDAAGNGATRVADPLDPSSNLILLCGKSRHLHGSTKF
jgi:hypothetical protein